MQANSPNIFHFDDYRLFLHAWKTAHPRISFRSFARRAGFGAHDIFQLVASGRRNLSRRSTRKFTVALNLKEHEAAYFESLVNWNQADSPEDRAYYYRQLLANHAEEKTRSLNKRQLQFFRNWLAPVILEIALFPGFSPDPSWIAGCFAPALPVDEVRAVLDDLISIGLLAQDASGRWMRHHEHLHTGDRIQDEYLFAYHETALAKASDALHEVAAENRQFHVVTTAVPSALLPDIKRLAESFERKLLHLIEETDQPYDDVVQVSTQIFSILKSKIRRNKK